MEKPSSIWQSWIKSSNSIYPTIACHGLHSFQHNRKNYPDTLQNKPISIISEEVWYGLRNLNKKVFPSIKVHLLILLNRSGDLVLSFPKLEANMQNPYSTQKISTQIWRLPAGLIKLFRIWLLRARKGGLHEAVDLLEEAVKPTIKLRFLSDPTGISAAIASVRMAPFELKISSSDFHCQPFFFSFSKIHQIINVLFCKLKPFSNLSQINSFIHP